MGSFLSRRLSAPSRPRVRSALLAAAVVTGGLAAAFGGSGVARAASLSITTLGEDSFLVPAGVTALHVVATGAAGGNGSDIGGNATAGTGGAGAVVTADIQVIAGQVLYTNIGGGGAAVAGGSGGDSADLRTCSVADCSLSTNDTRRVVAGGGGGGGATVNAGQVAGNGGDAGVTFAAPCYPGSNGTDGSGTVGTKGLGGTCGAGGDAGVGVLAGNPGGLGFGGDTNTFTDLAGGGGGYYGGGASGEDMNRSAGGGGGGASFVDPVALVPGSSVSASLAGGRPAASLVITFISAAADLSIDKVGSGHVNAGQTMTYSLTVRNHGGRDADNVSVSDTLTETVAGSITNVSADLSDAPGFTCPTLPGLVLSFTCGNAPTGSLAAWDAATIYVTLTFSPTASGSVTNVATVSWVQDTGAPGLDPDLSNNTARIRTDVNPAVQGPAGPQGPAGEDGHNGHVTVKCPKGYTLVKHKVHGKQIVECKKPKPKKKKDDHH